MLLVGDIGGTHARLVLLSPAGKRVRHEVFDSRTFKSLDAVARQFLGKKPPRITAAAFGVAGPVVNGRCVATNLPWVIDARVLSRKLRIRQVTLLNDLVALALGAIAEPASKLRRLAGGGLPRTRGATVAVIAAGTGLGEAMLVWDGKRHVASATEGGHVDFAPRDETEVELWRFLKARLGGRVSYERLVSGMGLGNLYDFFREARGVPETVDALEAIQSASDRNAAIAQLGMANRSEAARQAVGLFASIYGAEAGNLALKTLAVGGVLVCGAIAGKMLPVLERGGFHLAFVDKGRFRPLVEKIPIAVVLDDDVGLKGATRVAMGDV
ncbi:MAG TPA: glucokinase [Polyangiaceae bacterium]|nr:glucokinase [Polyangiaceae bacterium]